MNVDALPAYVITLKEEAFHETKKRLADGGFKNLEWFKGVNGKEMADQLRNDRNMLSFRALVEIDHAEYRECHSSLPSWGGVGCYMSHLEMWKKARDSENGIIVFEQDAVPASKDAYKNVKEVLEKLYKVNDNKLPDYVNIGGFNIPEHEEIPGVPNTVRAKGRMYGSEAYYISPEGGSKLVQNALPIEVQCDSYTGYVITQSYNKPDAFLAYVIKDKYVSQENQEGTSIQLKPIRDVSPGGEPFDYNYIVLTILVLILFGLMYQYRHDLKL